MVKEIKNIGVIGSGIMGVGIAQSFAEAGLSVSLIDVEEQALEQGMNRIQANLSLFEEFDLLRESPSVIAAKIEPVATQDLAADTQECDFIVESVPEVLDIKQNIFRQLDVLPEKSIIASNTSSMPMDAITEGLQTPRRMVGLHYFNPAHIIPAIEIHKGKETAPEVMETTKSLMVRTGKKPVIVQKTVPGFIINRLTGAMEREIDFLIDEGIVTPEDLDTVVKASYGFRLACMGPMAQEDMVGLDTSARVSANIFKVLSNKTEPSPVLLDKVAKGELGIKSGKGWYDYSGQTGEEIADRINRRLLQQLALFKSVER